MECLFIKIKIKIKKILFLYLSTVSALLIFILFHIFFSFLCYFSLSSLYFLALVVVPSLFMATIPIYTSLSLFDFSILPPWLTNHFCLL